jgi:hypothetical protein
MTPVDSILLTNERNRLRAVPRPSAGASSPASEETPAQVLAALDSWTGPALIDLDETLYLRNATEDFLDSARPATLALMLLNLLDLIRPWRWTGGPATRDPWRVLVVRALLPWTAALWRRRVTTLAREFTNRRLLSTLRRRGAPPTIVTPGLHSVVEPLLHAMSLGDVPMVAAGRNGFADRRRDKLALAIRALGEVDVRGALVLTASDAEDLSLLAACASPLRTRWPAARYRRALLDVYLPGEYLTHVKRPGERYVLRGIVQDDFAYWVLCSIALAAAPLQHVTGLAFLLLSFWAVYERGYVDNDLVGARHELDPKLSDAFHTARVATPIWWPWVWSLAAGLAGIAILRWPNPPQAHDVVGWTAVLVATHLLFLLFNRLDKLSRVWLYAGLQLARAAAFTVLVPVLPIGAVALGANVLARWVPYSVYRFATGGWRNGRTQTTGLLFFVVMATMLALTNGRAVLNWTTVALLGWGAFRARNEIRQAISDMRLQSGSACHTGIDTGWAHDARPIRRESGRSDN